MNNFIKLNLGLLKYIKLELKKKRKPNELVHFFGKLGKIYFTELLKLYKNLLIEFNPEYKKQKKQHNNYQEIKKQLNQALKLLKYIDTKMEKAGIKRQQRRQFWRDFYKDGSLRKEVFENLLKEIERIG